MRLLLDTCVWGGAVAVLQKAGHDVIWVGDWDTDPGDETILAQGHEQKRVLVTLDKDFGELAVVYDKPHSGIVRLVGIPARKQGPYCSHILERYQQELQQGAIITVTRKTTGQPEESFVANVMDTMTFFHQENGAWKYWSHHVLGARMVQ